MKKNVILLIALLFAAVSPSAFAQLISSKHGMVVSEHRLATAIGKEILAKGGNAVDAAVAVGYALAVVNPCCGNIGGGGFMTIHLADGRNIFLNFREKAPLAATKDMYLHPNSKETSTLGYLAVAVPGTVLGLDTALQKYGTLSRHEVMAGAIALAKNGFLVTPYLAQQLNQVSNLFSREPNIAAIFLKNGHPLQVGEQLTQTNLAHTLTLIDLQGPSQFYRGEIARKIVNASKKKGGLLTQQDFNQYNITELTPIECSYRGYTLITAPPPSGGGITLCEMLNILENFPLKQYGYSSARNKQIIIETMRYGFHDRNTLGDPHFVYNPLTQLLSKKYAKEISKKIETTYIAPPPMENKRAHELSDTTHYSVADDKGNAVSVTYTLNGFFGAKVMAEDTGFFLNNDMDDFATHPGNANQFGLVEGKANEIAPGKRPLSSMTPTIVMKNNKVIFILGSPGGPRIISSVLLALLNLIDFKMNLDDAIHMPRFHFQGLPNIIDTEPFAFDFITSKTLTLWGYPLSLEPYWSAVEGIYIDPKTRVFYGANDDRRPDGEAAG